MPLRHRPLATYMLRQPALHRVTLGLVVTGTPPELAIIGTRATGPGRLMPAHIGSLRAITVITTIEVIGAARPLVVSQIRWHDLNLGNSNPRVKFCN